MRRVVFTTLGALELLVGLLLLLLASALPTQDEVSDSFQKVERVTTQTGGQVTLLRKQLRELRRPELQQLAARLQAETRDVTAQLEAQALDYRTLEAMAQSLGQVANSLTGIAAVLDPIALGQLARSLEATAAFYDKTVVPAAAKAADDLEESAALLQADIKRLGVLLQFAPPDLKAAREVHDCLVRFGEGMAKMNESLSPKRVEAMRDGFRGLQTSLHAGAEQVERLSGFSYPVVTFRGLKPHVENRKFWPEGDTIAQGMRKAAAGASAAAEEMEAFAGALPTLRASLDEGRKVADRTRDALAVALKYQDQLEPLLKDLPAHTARLAQTLPNVGTDLAKVLRKTEQMKTVAASLRQTQKRLDEAAAGWPLYHTTLTHSSKVLQEKQAQLNHTLKNRDTFEAAMRQTLTLADAVSAMLPLFIEQLEKQLAEQERALGDLNQSIDQVNESLPAYGKATSKVVHTGRLLAWLLAALVGLHGLYLVGTVWLGKQYSM